MTRSHNQKQQIRPVSRAAHRMAVIGSVVAVLATYAVVGPVSSASAAFVGDKLPGSNFEIDANANLTVDGASPSIDWLNDAGTGMRTGVVRQQDKTSGTGDDSFGQGTSENDAVPTVVSGSIPPNKSDLTNFGVFQEGNSFLHLFWTRVLDPNGDTNMDFEFNKSQTLSSNGVTPVRSPGDMLITYDVSNGGAVVTMWLRTWGGSSWSAAISLSGDAIGSFNTTTILAANSGGLGLLTARTFGEASIDLSKIFPAGQCNSFGSAYVKSRASDSFNSELKDFIAPVPVTVTNCGHVAIHKTDQAGAPLAGAVFTLYNNVAPLTPPHGVGDTITTLTCTTNASGDCTIVDVPFGQYMVVETTTPPNHDTAADQAVDVEPSGNTPSGTLTFVDPIQTGTITVVKDAIPDDPQDFSYTLDATSFSLDDDPVSQLPNTRTYTVPVGSHVVTEAAVDGWVLTGLSCVDATGKPVGNIAGATATVTLTKGENVTCTYTNTFSKLGVDLQTQVGVPSAPAGSWNDSASLTGDGTHDVTGSVLFFACAAHPTATACSTGGTQVGGAATVTGSGTAFAAHTTSPYTPADAGWTCFRAVFTSTSAFYASSSQTAAANECFLKQAQNLTVSKTATAAFGRLYSWTIDKVVDKNSVNIPDGGTATSTYDVTVANSHVDSAWTVTGSITVTNPNPVPFTGVTVTDAINNGASCVVTDGTSATVPANDTLVVSYTCIYTSAPSADAGTNTATATWDSTAFSTPAASATGSASVDFSKVTPSVTDEIVDVSDSVHGTLGTGTLDARTAANPTVFHYTVDRSGIAGTCTAYPNTATFTTNDSEISGTADASVTVCVGVDLTVSKTALATDHRTFLWAINKSVDQTTQTVPAGDTATFNYTVTATPSGTTDDGWSVTGQIKVTNPNDWESITADISDVVDSGGGADCTVSDGTGIEIAALATVTLDYSCTFASKPSDGTNTATATWDSAGAATPTGSATGTAAVVFVPSSQDNETITVVDDKTDPAHPVTLGTATYGDTPTVFTYSLTKTTAAGGSFCTTYTNVATLVETKQSDSQDVQLCGTFTGGGGTPVVTPPAGGGLPFTGDFSLMLSRWALALLAAGGLLVLLGRRRSTT